jgi:hypothetical protein
LEIVPVRQDFSTLSHSAEFIFTSVIAPPYESLVSPAVAARQAIATIWPSATARLQATTVSTMQPVWTMQPV